MFHLLIDIRFVITFGWVDDCRFELFGIPFSSEIDIFCLGSRGFSLFDSKQSQDFCIDGFSDVRKSRAGKVLYEKQASQIGDLFFVGKDLCLQGRNTIDGIVLCREHGKNTQGFGQSRILLYGCVIDDSVVHCFFMQEFVQLFQIQNTIGIIRFKGRGVYDFCQKPSRVEQIET